MHGAYVVVAAGQHTRLVRAACEGCPIIIVELREQGRVDRMVSNLCVGVLSPTMGRAKQIAHL